MLTGSEVALFTDLYELTMAASFHAHGFNVPVTFELYVRDLPPTRSYLLLSGLERALDGLEALQFDDTATDYLASLSLFSDEFLSELSRTRFQGEVWAIPEGEVAFPDEPLVQVRAPLVEAQIVETFLLNAIGYDTMVATKAARVAEACAGRPFFDFSARRDHGVDAALRAARASYIGGASGTSLVLAGERFGLALAGTMAHSYVMALGDETTAFRTFASDYGARATLLIDTNDTLAGADIVAALGDELRAAGMVPGAVRLDSGDVVELARGVRAILDRAGLSDVRIFVSGDLDEYRIASVLAAGAPIDGFGVGTRLGTSADAPSLGVVYKLVEGAGGPTMKHSTDKLSLPGRKQVYRVEPDGTYAYDVLTLFDEPAPPHTRPLLEPVMAKGPRTRPPEPLDIVRDRATAALRALPPALHALEREGPSPDEVRRSAALDALVEQLTPPGTAPR